jgi:hypothetical protein
MAKRSKSKNHEQGPILHKVLSPRGEWLERANAASQNINIHNNTQIVIRQDDEGKDIVVKVGQRCPVCKKRIRGLNHLDGAHHAGNVPKHSRR